MRIQSTGVGYCGRLQRPRAALRPNLRVHRILKGSFLKMTKYLWYSQGLKSRILLLGMSAVPNLMLFACCLLQKAC